MSKATEVRRIALSHVGKPYGWGEEGRYVVGVETTEIDDVDCSGEIYATFREAGVLYKGKTLWRDTADGYWKLVTKKLTKPERIGDCCWFPRTGKKKHIALYLGDDTVIEAGYHGPSNAYPGAHYVGTCTIAQMNARGAVWGRITGLDIYDEEEDDMDQATFDQYMQEWLKNRENVATTYATADINAARQALDEEGLLDLSHKGSAVMSTSLFAVIVHRLMKKAGL